MRIAVASVIVLAIFRSPPMRRPRSRRSPATSRPWGRRAGPADLTTSPGRPDHARDRAGQSAAGLHRQPHGHDPVGVAKLCPLPAERRCDRLRSFHDHGRWHGLRREAVRKLRLSDQPITQATALSDCREKLMRRRCVISAEGRDIKVGYQVVPDSVIAAGAAIGFAGNTVAVLRHIRVPSQDLNEEISGCHPCLGDIKLPAQ